MPKFTRTAYAAGSLAAIAREIANQAGLEDLANTYDDLHARKVGRFKRRVRVTITVEPEQAPVKRHALSRRPRPVQQVLPLEAAR